MNTTTVPVPRRPRTPRTHAPLCPPTRPPAPRRVDVPDPSDAATPHVYADARDGDVDVDHLSTPARGGTDLDLPTIPVGAAADNALAHEINRAHKDGRKLARKALHHVRRAGELLIRAKESLGHGRFQAWVAGHCAFSYDTAAKYMRVARHWDQLVDGAGPNMERVADLPYRAFLQLIADRSTDRLPVAAVPPEPGVATGGGEPGPAPEDAPDPAAFTPAARLNLASARPARPRPLPAPPDPRDDDEDAAELDPAAEDFGDDPVPPVRPARLRPEPARPGSFPWPGLPAGPAAEAMNDFRDPIQSALNVLVVGFSPARIDVWSRDQAWESSAEYRAALVRLLQSGGPSELADCGRCFGRGTDGDHPCRACHGTGTAVVK